MKNVRSFIYIYFLISPQIYIFFVVFFLYLVFIVGDNASEYLEEGNAVDDMEAIEESESVLGDEVGNDDITESLRVNILTQKNPFFIYTIFQFQ